MYHEVAYMMVIIESYYHVLRGISHLVEEFIRKDMQVITKAPDGIYEVIAKIEVYGFDRRDQVIDKPLWVIFIDINR